MTEQQKIRHASRQALIQYSLGGLTDAEMAELENHFVECDTCAARSVGVHRLAGVFDHLPERVAPAEAPNPAGVAERIWAALAGTKEALGGVLGLVGLETDGTVLSLTASEYRSLVPRSSPFFQLAVAGDSGLRVRGAIRTRGSAGKPRPSSGDAPSEVKAEAGGEAGQPKWTIVAVGGEGKVIALLERWAAARPLPICMIMAAKPGTPFMPQVVEWVEEGSGLRAQRDVPRGTYIVALVGREPGEMGPQ
ncbi:MAG: hypothetical protein NTW28_06600 [Candidatus Solibacter sp.]|nr:hypothetical protein [Candidatus Solibacter sp.]